jgi:hypothetical protein
MAEKIDIFHERMLEHVNPGSSAKDLIERMVKSALEVEYGAQFTMNPGFAKMVSKIADSIVSNPELRRQSLSVASTYIEKKMETTKLRPASNAPKMINVRPEMGNIKK